MVQFDADKKALLLHSNSGSSTPQSTRSITNASTRIHASRAYINLITCQAKCTRVANKLRYRLFVFFYFSPMPRASMSNH